MLIDHTMNSVKDTFAPKIDVIIPHGMINKPSVCGASYFIDMKVTSFIKTDVPYNTSGIYVILSSINNNGYVGSASNLKLRKYQHFKSLEEKRHINHYIQHHYNKYGKNDIWFGIIESVPRLLDEDIELFKIRLLAKEQYWIDLLQPEFNICKKADSPLGVKRSKSTTSRMKRNHANFSGENHPCYGKHPIHKPRKKEDKPRKKRKIEINPRKLRKKEDRLRNPYKKRTEKQKQSNRISTIKLWQNPEYRKNQIIAMKNGWLKRKIINKICII